MRTDLLQLVVIFIISISLHEFAHAYVSYKLGDPTPKLQGRLTINPLSHIDLIGLVMIFLVQFGWGRPVQVNPAYYKKQIVGEFKVAIAGPLTNLLLAIFSIILLLIVNKFSNGSIHSLFIQTGTIPFMKFLIQFSRINIILAVFNMLPIPPLDGFTLVKLISISRAKEILKYQQYIFIGLLLLVFTTPLGNALSLFCNKIFEIILLIFANII